MDEQTTRKLRSKERLQKTGAFLKQLRNERKMTLPGLAAALGVSPDSISRYERGERYPSFEVLYNYIELFQVSFMEIANGERS